MALNGPAALAAVTVLEGRRIVDGAELASRVRAVRAAVAGHARVALLPPASADGIAAILGLLGAPVATVILNPRWSDAELLATIARTGATRLLHASDRLPAGVAAIAADLRTLPPAPSDPAGDPSDPSDPSDPAGDPVGPGGELVLPTSGTTSSPRLVRLPLDRLVASARGWASVLPPAEGWLLSLGLGHVAGIGIVVRAALAGVPLVIPPAGGRLDAAIADAATAGIVVTHASLVPTQLARLIDDGVSPPTSLRAVLLGGGPIPPSLVTRALDAGWPVHPTWGMTETASAVTAATPDGARRAPGAAGRPLPGMEVRVADPANPDRTCAVGTAGELQVCGPVVAAGLLDDDAGWRARRTDDGWLRSGDLGRIDDGVVTVIERIDDLIVRDGENVAPAEVEAALLALPGVREAAVVGAPDTAHGSVPVAFIVAGPGEDPSDAGIAAACSLVLARFQQPAAIVRAPELPRIGPEKIRRRALRPAAVDASARPLPPADGGPEPRRLLARDGALLLARADERLRGDRRPAIVLLHATLSSSRQLLRLAGALGDVGRVIVLDRRGSGGSAVADPVPVPVERHVEDVVDLLDALGEPRAVIVGHSFGGVVGLELAARRPDRVAALLAWEPPYIPLAPEPDRTALSRVADLVTDAWASGGPAATARLFLGFVAPGTLERMPADRLGALDAAGGGVLADAARPALDPAGLARIAAPVVIATGGASEPWYAPIADALVTTIAGARRVTLPDARHPAPIVTPGPIADLVRALPSIAGSPPAPSEDRP